MAAPSANISNTVSPTSALRVEQSLGDRIPYILDGGSAKIGLESTIVAIVNDAVVILREGGISKEQLEEVVKQEIIYQSTNEVSAPGQLKKHYATQKPLLLVKDIKQAVHSHQDKKVSVLLLSKVRDLNCFKSYMLSQNNDLSEAANNLFEMMSQADEDDSDIILVQEAPERGIGRAINDRLRRASAS